MKRQKSAMEMVNIVRQMSDAELIALCTLSRRLYCNRSGDYRVLNDHYLYETYPTIIFEDEMQMLEKFC